MQRSAKDGRGPTERVLGQRATASCSAGTGAVRSPAGAVRAGSMNSCKTGSSPEPRGDQASKDAKRSRHSEGTTEDDLGASYEGTTSGLAGKGMQREEPGSDEEDSDDDVSDGAGKDDARGGIKQPPPPPGQSGPACCWSRGRARLWRPRLRPALFGPEPWPAACL